MSEHEDEYSSGAATPSPLDASHTYLFTGPVKTRTVRPLIEWVIAKNLEAYGIRPKKRPGHLNLIISSLGGHVSDCFAAVDVLLCSRVPIRTVGLGGLASCGLTLFLCGSKRFVAPHALITSHQYSGGSDGKHHELLAERAAQDWTHEALIELYCKQTAQSRVYVEPTFFGPSDRHFSAQQAVDTGLAHGISHNFY